jgi:hypothetical protein
LAHAAARLFHACDAARFAPIADEDGSLQLDARKLILDVESESCNLRRC